MYVCMACGCSVVCMVCDVCCVWCVGQQWACSSVGGHHPRVSPQELVLHLQGVVRGVPPTGLCRGQPLSLQPRTPGVLPRGAWDTLPGLSNLAGLSFPGCLLAGRQY